MSLVKEAFLELFPEKFENRIMLLKYSAKFSKYNANVKYDSNKITFSLSNDWKDVSKEIQKGLIQSLFVRVFKSNIRTIYIDLYEKFVKNIPRFSQTTQIDLILKASFERVNNKYFFGFLDLPNLVFGRESFSKLGSYDYMSNTITLSTALLDDEELLDYVMYHEMLHQKLKFYTKNGRNYHHTSKFREKERAFENPVVEKKLKSFLAKKRMKKLFRLW
ncbi:MAG: SprT-like domain-containing protein [Nanoarchaeota archaeon]|nr:SprT-like domain-containing protein [Nanoarchaeota archaeon]MBU1031287.1 SprT-like domain-containing protein [Nanoarchaeota archaeon]MBU1849517.1 SprT-like domain-containing protein [Nanoarchaeota archaeon]